MRFSCLSTLSLCLSFLASTALCATPVRPRQSTPTKDEVIFPTLRSLLQAQDQTVSIRWYVTKASLRGDGASYELSLVRGVNKAVVEVIGTSFSTLGAGLDDFDWVIKSDYEDGYDYRIKIAYDAGPTLYSDAFSIFHIQSTTTSIPAALSRALSTGVIGTKTTSGSTPTNTNTASTPAQPTSTKTSSTTSSKPSTATSSGPSVSTLAIAIASSIGGTLVIVGVAIFLLRRFGCCCGRGRHHKIGSGRGRPSSEFWGTPEIDGTAMMPKQYEMESKTGPISNQHELDSNRPPSYASRQHQDVQTPQRQPTERWELPGGFV